MVQTSPYFERTKEILGSAGAVADGFKNTHRHFEVLSIPPRLYLTLSLVEVGSMEVLEGHCGLEGDSEHTSECGGVGECGMTGWG